MNANDQVPNKSLEEKSEAEKKRLEEKLETQRKYLIEILKAEQFESDLTENLIQSLKTSVLEVIKHDRNNINIKSLNTIFEKPINEIFKTKVPISKKNRIFGLVRLESDIEVNDNLNHCFKTIFDRSVYKKQDFSEITSEMLYIIELSNILNETIQTYFESRNLHLLYKIHMDNKLNSFTDTDSNNKTFFPNSSKRAETRPDFCVSDPFNRVLLKGQLRREKSDFSEAKQEIMNKKFVTNNVLDSHGSFAFVSAGCFFQLFYLSANGSSKCDGSNLVLDCNLNDVSQRVKLIKDLICLCYLMELISKDKPMNIYCNFFKPIENRDKTRIIQFDLNNTVIKKLKIEWIERTKDKFSIYFQKLKKFYQILIDGKIANSIQFIDMYQSDDYLEIITTPICESTVQIRVNSLNDFKILFRSLIEAVDSMHNNSYAHCDIRWPNIVFDCVASKYLLIDFENIEKLCSQNCKSKHKCITRETDYKMIAHLIDDLKNRFLSQDLTFVNQFQKNLLNTGKDIKEILEFLD